VGGLPLALRLALDAQRAGAAEVVCPERSGVPALLVTDARLRIPVVTTPSPGLVRVVAPASLLVHRDAFKAALAGGLDAIVLGPGAPAPDGTPYAFAALDVTDKATAARAERLLFHSLRKPQDGWTSRYLNRHVSLAISRLLVKTPLRPNQLSIAILGVGIAGALVAAEGTYAALVLGALLFQTQSILDGCDGEMSRVTYRGSLLGEWLDTIGDDLTNYGFFAGAAWGLHATTGNALYLAAGAVTVVAGATASLIEYRYLYRIGSGDLLKYPASQTASDAVSGATSGLALLAPLLKRDTFVLLTLVAALVGQVGPMLVLFALGAAGILVNVIRTEIGLARAARG
jgi:phosphatidylglycerophosphate synthase